MRKIRIQNITLNKKSLRVEIGAVQDISWTQDYQYGAPFNQSFNGRMAPRVLMGITISVKVTGSRGTKEFCSHAGIGGNGSTVKRIPGGHRMILKTDEGDILRFEVTGGGRVS